MEQIEKYIEMNPEKRFGKPVIKGTRISVYDILSWLSEGMSKEDIMKDFPEIKEEQILLVSVGSHNEVY